MRRRVASSPLTSAAIAYEAGAHCAGSLQYQRLGRDRMQTLGHTDSPGQRTQAAERAYVAVRAGDREPRQRDTQLRRGNVNDALPSEWGQAAPRDLRHRRYVPG